MAWVAVDKNGNEHMFENKPSRGSNEGAMKWKCMDGFWIDETVYDETRMYTTGADDYHIHLPKGSIKKLIGRTLTWNDKAVELK